VEFNLTLRSEVISQAYPASN